LVCYVVFFSRLLVSRFIFHIPIMQIPFALLFPYTTLFRSHPVDGLLTRLSLLMPAFSLETPPPLVHTATSPATRRSPTQHHTIRSEEHTSELQSRIDLVCRLLLEKKKITQTESDSREEGKI